MIANKTVILLKALSFRNTTILLNYKQSKQHAKSKKS